MKNGLTFDIRSIDGVDRIVIDDIPRRPATPQETQMWNLIEEFRQVLIEQCKLEVANGNTNGRITPQATPEMGNPVAVA